MEYYFYILYSVSTDKYYIGSSDDPTKRFGQHNSGRNTSTRHGMPWQIVYTEPFSSRTEAYKREVENQKETFKSRYCL